MGPSMWFIFQVQNQPALMEKKIPPPPHVFWFPGYLTMFRLFLEEGTGTPLQYSGLDNPMDGGAW